MKIGEKITASEGKVFRLIHNKVVIGEIIYVGYIWIDGVKTPFSMDLIEEIDKTDKTIEESI
jgi:hypothetical protein